MSKNRATKRYPFSPLHSFNSSRTGVFILGQKIERPIPTKTNEITQEYIHPSVLEQAKLFPNLALVLDDHPDIVGELLPLEEEFKLNWPYKASSDPARSYSLELEKECSPQSSPTPTQSNAFQELVHKLFFFKRHDDRPTSPLSMDPECEISSMDQQAAMLKANLVATSSSRSV